MHAARMATVSEQEETNCERKAEPPFTSEYTARAELARSQEAWIVAANVVKDES
jgi:hypothetical protein